MTQVQTASVSERKEKKSLHCKEVVIKRSFELSAGFPWFPSVSDAQVVGRLCHKQSGCQGRLDTTFAECAADSVN